MVAETSLYVRDVWPNWLCDYQDLPGLSGARSVCALIEAIEAFCKFSLKLNIQKVLLPIAEHSGRENTNLFMGRIMKNWKNLEQEKMGIVLIHCR